MRAKLGLGFPRSRGARLVSMALVMLSVPGLIVVPTTLKKPSLKIGDARGTQDSAPDSKTHPPVRGYDVEPFELGSMRGKLKLEIPGQRLTIHYDSPNGDAGFDILLPSVLPVGFQATCVAQLAGGDLVIGGQNKECGGGSILLTSLLTGEKKLQVPALEWGGVGMVIVSDITVYPSGNHLVLLDTSLKSLFVCDVRSGRIRRATEIEDSHALATARYLDWARVPGFPGSINIIASFDEPGSPVGTFSGPMAMFLDSDDDGVFEK